MKPSYPTSRSIKRKIKIGEIEKLGIKNYSKKELEQLIQNTSRRIGLDRNGLRELLKKNNLSFDSLVKKFETDLKWNSMIFQIYKNKISLNTVEIESKINLELENLEDKNDEKKIKMIKKNLETHSTEFYNLSYNYLNDCLKAGLVFRSEFYSDRDIEASDSLMFQISLLPFGGVPVPLIDR